MDVLFGIGSSNSVQIGLATSSDGINWNRYSSLPIFKCADNTSIICRQSTSWSSYRVAITSVIYDEGIYKMWYGGNNQSPGPYWQLGYATSSDGINWNAYKNNYVYDADDLPSVVYTNVIKVDGVYRLYFTDARNKKAYYTESTDGINWNSSKNLVVNTIINSVDVVGDSFVAVSNTKTAFSSDGKSFDFSSSSVFIENNSTPDQARINFLLEDGVVKTWRTHNLGNIIWSYVNFGINYATLDEDLFFEGFETEEANKYPLYTQIESPYPSIEETAGWADDSYASGEKDRCFSLTGDGNTIRECGCAITSLLMAGRNVGIETDILGEDVNPGNMNEYLQSVEGYSPDGSLFWLAGSAYLGEFTSSGKISSRFSTPYDTTNISDIMKFIDDSLEEGNKAVLAYKEGHYVWLPEKTEDSYIVRDPAYYLTQTADDDDASFVNDYNNYFTTARIIDISDEPVVFSKYGIEAYLKGTAELLFKKSTGEKVGYVDGSVLVDLDSALYGNTEIIGFDGVPADSAAGKHLLVHDAGEEFTIDVVGTGTGEFELEFFTINEFGETSTFNFSGITFEGVETTFTFNLETGEVEESEIDYDKFQAILDIVLADKSLQVQKFFAKRAEKLYEDMEDKTVSQVLHSIETFGKLLNAKKVKSPVIFSVLDLLKGQVSE